MRAKHYLTVYLPPTLASRLEAEARARGVSMSLLVREAVVAYLDGRVPRSSEENTPSGDPLAGLAVTAE